VSLELVLIACAIAFGGVTIVFGLILLSPARTVLEVDTSMGLAHLRLRPLWGLGPETAFMRNRGNVKTSRVSKLLSRLRDLPRMAHAALVLPKLVAPAKQLLNDIGAMKPSASRIVLSVNAAHPLANLAVEVVGALPDTLRRGVEIRTRETIGLDLVAHIEADAPPLRLYQVYRRFRTEPNVAEFLSRLRKDSGEPRT
jgi:hypothetical protein